MWLTVYLGGLIVTTIGVFVAGHCLHDPHAQPRLPMRAALSVLAGALWPLVVLGVAELIFVAVVTRLVRTVSSRPHVGAPIKREEAAKR